MYAVALILLWLSFLVSELWAVDVVLLLRGSCMLFFFCFQDCSFVDNQAQRGGGLSITLSSQVDDLLDTTFIANVATSLFGGGMELTHCSSVTTAKNLLFNNNSAPNGDGGALYTTMVSSINLKSANFSYNRAAYGGGIRMYYETTLIADDLLFYRNECYDPKKIKYPTLLLGAGGGLYFDGDCMYAVCYDYVFCSHSFVFLVRSFFAAVYSFVVV